MKEEEHRLYGRPCLLVQLYADGSVCFQAFAEMKNRNLFGRMNHEKSGKAKRESYTSWYL